MSSFSTAVVSADLAFRKPNRIRRRKNRNQTSSGSMFVMGAIPSLGPLYQGGDQSSLTDVKREDASCPAHCHRQVERHAGKLRSTADRWRRLAGWIIDRQATEALLLLANECDERAAELQNQTTECG